MPRNPNPKGTNNVLSDLEFADAEELSAYDAVFRD